MRLSRPRPRLAPPPLRRRALPARAHGTLACLTILAPLTLLATLASTACGGPDPRELPASPQLVHPNAERLAALHPDATSGNTLHTNELPPDRTPRGAQAFTRAEEFEAFRQSCDAEQPRELPHAAGLGANANPQAGEPGQIYRGAGAPPALPPLAHDNILRLAETNPEFIDPNKVAEQAGSDLVATLFDTLYAAAPGNSPPVPSAAERTDVSPDGKTLTFHLRPGMVWSDGHPVTAEDFRYSWLRALDPATGSRNAQLLWFIVGAKSYSTGVVKTSEGVKISAPDPLTFVVELQAPTPFFLDITTYASFAPVPRWAIEKWGNDWTRPEHLVSNGPFTLTVWAERDRFEMKKNPRFWDAAHVALDGVVVYHSDDEKKNENLYASGQIHVARPLSPESVRSWIRGGRSDLRIDLNMCNYFYVIRTDRAPFDDVDMRRALDLALDKERVASHILGGFQKVATTLVPDITTPFSGYVPPPGPAYDRAEAQRILVRAGYPNGQGLGDVELLYNNYEVHKRIAEYVASNWQEAIGVHFTTANMEWKSLLKRQNAGDFHVSRSGWCADYPDAMAFLEIFQSDSENNYPAYKNPAYDQLLERARLEPDRRSRNVLLCAAEKGLMRDMPIVPIYQYTRATLIRPEVRGYPPQYQDHHLLRWVSLDLSGAN